MSPIITFPTTDKVKFIRIVQVPIGQVFRFEGIYYELLNSDLAQKTEHNPGPFTPEDSDSYLVLDKEILEKRCAVKSDSKLYDYFGDENYDH